MKFIRIFLFSVLIVVVAVIGFFAYLFAVYPKFDYSDPAFLAKADYDVIDVDGYNVLIASELPYPTDFEKSSYPTQDLNGTWKMRFDPDEIGDNEGWEKIEGVDDNWEDIKIPSTYNYFNGPYRGHGGLTWYLLKFTPGYKKTPERFIRLCFEGVLLRSKIWINGELVGEHEGGYTPFYFDVTEYIREGEENTLVIRADNRLTYDSLPTRSWKKHNPGWGVYGGVYRGVGLEWIPRQYIFKAVVESETSGDISNLDVTLFIHNHDFSGYYIFSGSIVGPYGTIYESPPYVYHPRSEIETYTLQFEIEDPRLWSPKSPDLYELNLSIKTKGAEEIITTKFGIREIEIDGYGLYLNGEEVFLRGICKHEDDPDLGATQTEEIISRDLKLIDDMGANYIRMAHYPHDTREIRAARDMGIMVAEEIPFYIVGTGWTAWYEEKKSIFEFPVSTFGMKQLGNHDLLSNTKRQIIEMIERDRNNPAVIMWGVGNESYTLARDAGRIYGYFSDVAKSFDNTRPVTMAELTYDIPPLDNMRRSAEFMDIVSLNSYYGWYYGTIEGAAPHFDNFHSRYPDKPIVLSEFGASAAPGRIDSDGVFVADRVSPGKTYSEEYQDKIIREYIDIALARDYIVGVSPWVFSDFYCPWFPNNPIPYQNLKGVVSSGREPKMSYYSLKEIYRKLDGE